jgi:oxygen-independent coproporphyrinogen-3 oxidase
MNPALLKKYDVPCPRYTSYPTVPCWDEKALSEKEWTDALKQSFAESNSRNGISLYIHLPFCESLCTYCGCNTRITVNHKVEIPYIRTVLKEWSLYRALLPGRPKIRELHLGGGTPTFFSPANLELLINGIMEGCDLAGDYEFGAEGHPSNTTFEHLQTLSSLGFRRISFGIQDFDPSVQQMINRKQSFATVEEITHAARETGFESVNYDLIYGLPAQTEESVQNTIDKVSFLRPDRIAFYSYAHVPWMRPAQKKFESFLPTGGEKRKLYETGRIILEAAGYGEIGMDHFALPGDTLSAAASEKTLHRNFMGYTSRHTQLAIGLGVSSISDSWTAFAQNAKSTEEYQALVNAGKIPIVKGHCLTEEDLILRKHILNIMCRMETSWAGNSLRHPSVQEALQRLEEAESDGLVRREPFRLKVTDAGRPFLRNICSAFDARMRRARKKENKFSRAV